MSMPMALKDLEKSIMESAKAVQIQIDVEAEKIRQEKAQMVVSDNTHLGAGLVLLPWETMDDSKSILCDPLMEKILGLSIAEGNFSTSPKQDAFSLISFSMQKSVPVIMKLLQIDKNLARIHAKLSPKMDEELFWKNYFFRVKFLRAIVGMDGPDLQAEFGSILEEDVIYTVQSPIPISAKVTQSDNVVVEASEKPKVDAAEDAAAAEVAKKMAEDQARRDEALRLEAEVLAELNEDIDENSGCGSPEMPPDVLITSAGSMNDLSIGDEDDDDAALEAMIAKELGEEVGDLDDEDGFEDDDEDLDFS